MKIIVEGCDGTGKTTLVKLLAEKYGLDICHCTSKDPADFRFYMQTSRKENVIWDRHTIGELIYPMVFNRKQQTIVEEAKVVLDDFRATGGKVLILTANNNIIHDRLAQRDIPEDSKIMQQLEWINEEFVKYAEIFSIPVIDTSKMTIEEIFALIE